MRRKSRTRRRSHLHGPLHEVWPPADHGEEEAGEEEDGGHEEEEGEAVGRHHRALDSPR